MKSKWVVFKPSKYGGVFAEDYWTGEFTDQGNPAKSSKTHSARQFSSAREAYDIAGKFKRLNWWRVGERKIETVH